MTTYWLDAPFGRSVAGLTRESCYSDGCTFATYHRGPHSHEIYEGEPRVGDLVYEKRTGFYGRVHSLTPQGRWHRSRSGRRIWVKWMWSRFDSDPRLSDIVIVRRKVQP